MQLRSLAVVGITAALIAAVLVPEPATAATIPTPPAVCHPTVTPGTPMLTAFAISHGVNVKAKAHSISVTLTATDPTKKITGIEVDAQSPMVGGEQITRQISLRLASGTAHDGTWKGALPIPRWTIPGTWQISKVGLIDAGGGYAYYFPFSGGSTYPWDPSWRKTFTVSSTVDLKAPSVSAFRLSRHSVDTSHGSAKIGVSVTASDNLSGVAAIGVSGYPVANTLMYSTEYGSGDLKLATGTATHGVWKGSIVVPAWVGSGTHPWTLSLSAYDLAGNPLFLDAPDLKHKHLTSTFQVTSRTDSTKPVLSSLTMSPTTVDARTHDRTVKVTVGASDTLSGLEGVAVTIRSRSGVTETAFSSVGSGMLFASATNAGTSRARGDARRVPVTLTIAQCSEPGTWTVTGVDIYDVSQNVKHYTTKQIKAKGGRTTLTVQALDNQGPVGTAPDFLNPTDPIPVTFSEPTVWKDGTAATALYVYDIATTTPVPGNWVCHNAAGLSVTCDATGAYPTSATFTPTAPFAAEHAYGIHSNDNDIYDTSGNGLSYVDQHFTTN